MDAALWREKIVDSCKTAGTYQPIFDDVIDTLADILERRDIALTQWRKKKQTIATYTNKGGNKNYVTHPQLKVVQECESSALAYWRELGLTPATYRKMTSGEIEFEKKLDPLSQAMKDLSFDT